MEYKYDDIIQNLSNRFEMELQIMSAVYNFDNGDEFEIAICNILRRFLPNKYGITRGFVVNGDGKTAGDDIIIYDQYKYPTLRFLEKDRYDRKEKIPVEAVYAYIEAKNTLTKETLNKAIIQTAKVKKLCYTRRVDTKENVTPREQYIFSNEFNSLKAWEPIIKNPIYSMIISKYSVNVENQQSENSVEINAFLVNEINKNAALLDSNKFYNPECIVAGNSNVAICGHYHFDEQGNKKDSIEITKFYTGLRPFCCYQVNEHKKLSYGLALAHLMLALNSIELVDMPWDIIFNCAKMPQIEERNKALNDISD